MSWERKTVDAPSGPVSVVMSDGAGCDVVLLHSMGLDAASFELVANALPGSVRAAAVDLWGHGETPMRTPMDLERVADDVAFVLRQNDRPVVLAGVSYGGVIAQLVAARSPELVAHLVLANTFAHWPGATERLTTHRAGWEAAGSDEQWYARRLDGALVPDAPARSRELYAEGARRNAGQDFFRSAELVYAADVTQVWDSITCPVTVVTGEHESRIPPAVTAHLVELARLDAPVVLTGADHLTYLERPKQFADVLLDALGTRRGET